MLEVRQVEIKVIICHLIFDIYHLAFENTGVKGLLQKSRRADRESGSAAAHRGKACLSVKGVGHSNPRLRLGKLRHSLKKTLMSQRDCGPPAQGCRFGYPGKLVKRQSTATRLRPFLREKCTSRHNRIAVDDKFLSSPRVAEPATLGWRLLPP